MIKCPNCNAELHYDIKSEKLKCDYCGSTFDSEQKLKINSAEKVEEKTNVKKTVETKSYRCKYCGATLLTFDSTAATFCNYCGQESMLEDKLLKINEPDYIIPFKITKEQCLEIIKKKLSKNIIIPNYMKKNIVLDKVHAIYMPYAVYNFSKNGIATSSGKKFYKRRGNYDYYKDYVVKTDIDVKIEGISYDLASKFYDQYSYAIAPFDFNEAIPFSANYISGFYANCKDVDYLIYSNEAYDKAKKYVNLQLKKRKEYKTYGCINPNISLFRNEENIGMFPVYFLSFKNKEKICYAVINGQTGKIAIDLPIDVKKFILFSSIVSIIVFLCINQYSELTFKTLLIIGIIIAFISILISYFNLNKIDIKKNHSDDKGLNKNNVLENKANSNMNKEVKLSIISFLGCLIMIYFFIKIRIFELFFLFLFIAVLFILFSIKVPNENKSVKKEQKKIKKFPYVYKQVIAIVLGFLILIINPFNDLYYYIATIVLFLIDLFSIFDIIKEHNILSTRMLPQLEKRGGD